MNILVVCHYGLYQDYGSSFVHNQIKEYCKLGHKAKVIIPIALGKKGINSKRFFPLVKHETVDDVELLYLRYISLSSYGEKNFNYYSAIFSINVLIKQEICKFNPDIVHAHTIGFDGRISNYLKKKLNVPSVITTHGSDTVVPLQNGQNEQICNICDQADRIVAVSNKLKTFLEKSGTKTRIQVIYNGFNKKNIDRSIEKLPYTIIQVSNLIEQKKVDKTIEAFSYIHKIYPYSKLKIIGEGPERKSLELLCEKLNLGESVMFCGKMKNIDVLDEMSKSIIFIMPSVNEGFGIVYLEAMSQKCVTIGTRGEGISEIIEDEINGFLVEKDNVNDIVERIKRCFSDSKYANEIANNGYMTSMLFSWEENARKYIGVFNDIIFS